MSNGNPTTALDAILETESNKTSIKPLTIARYALLELAESPLVTQGKKADLNNLIPSLYIMTQDINVLKGYNSTNIDKLVEEAFIWADNFEDLTLINDLIKKIVDKTKQVSEVAPKSKKAEATSQQMAG